MTCVKSGTVRPDTVQRIDCNLNPVLDRPRPVDQPGKARRTLVLGIGNTLLADEGAGIHALHALQRLLPSGQAVFVDGGTLSFSLLPEIEVADHLLVIDAAELNEPGGSVRVFEGADMDSFLGNQRKRSVHEVGLLDLMAVAQLTGTLPASRALIGIQPQVIDWGEHPSISVAQAIPLVCRLADALIRRWRDDSPPGARDQSNHGPR